MSSPFLDAQGNYYPAEAVLGNGNTAVVLLQNGVAVKVPLRYPWHSASGVDVNIGSIRREQDIFRRLNGPDDNRSSGVVRCIEFFPEATQLAYMAKGDLRTYLKTSRPTHQLQLKWFIDMAWTLENIHDRCVLVADIASRNFLLDSDLSIKMCDFSEASLLPLDCNMGCVDDNGYTTQIDIGLLGAVMYEVVTGESCKIDLYKGNSSTDSRAYWPERSYLPDTNGIYLGWIIEGCWAGQFRNARSLVQALHSVDSTLPSITQPLFTPLFSLRDSITRRSPMVAVGVLGLVICVFIIGKRGALKPSV